MTFIVLTEKTTTQSKTFDLFSAIVRKDKKLPVRFAECSMLNAGRGLVQFTKSAEVHPCNPKHRANPKPYPNPKITQRSRMESFYGHDLIQKNSAIYVFH